MLTALALTATPARGATDDQNLTGLVYLADGTSLSATPWADNTSFAVYVNHGGSWATAWRYPSSPSWYATSGGAYSTVLPAAQKDVSWSNGDPYRMEFDVSAISGTPGRIENATSYGTGDPGEFPPLGYTENAVVWNATDNWQRWDVVLLALPDLSVNASDVLVTPTPPVPTGTAVTIDALVRSLGVGPSTDVVVRFTDGMPPGIPIGTDVTWPPFTGGLIASRTWTAGPAGAHLLCVAADPDNATAESNETNNVACMDVLVVPGPETRPDLVPAQAEPSPPLRAGLSQRVDLSVQVRNEGNASANAMVLAFFNESTPATPFAMFAVPPLAPSAASARFPAPWTSPAAPGTVRVVAAVDYAGELLEWNETNNTFTWTVDVLAGPVTNLLVGQPNVTAAETYVTSATLLSFFVLDQSGAGIRNTTYRVDGGSPVNYTADGPFTLSGEGPHLVEWSSEDFAGNVEAVADTTLLVDDTPPTTTLSVGDPVYLVGGTFVNGTTPLASAAIDGGATPVGLDQITYRIWSGAWSSWAAYASSFGLGGPDGAHFLEYRSLDLLGNAEATRNETLVLDTIPPETTLLPASGPYTTDTRFSLSPEDAGSGVDVTAYSVDGGAWIPYALGFTLAAGNHTIRYNSTDHLGNREAVRTRAVRVEGPAPPTEANYKPLVAAVFATVLAAVGAWASRRRPWKDGAGRKAMLSAFVATSLPFMLAEAATGAVSLVTGLLAIPPVVGTGTVVDVAILATGLAAAVIRAR